MTINILQALIKNVSDCLHDSVFLSVVYSKPFSLEQESTFVSIAQKKIDFDKENIHA